MSLEYKGKGILMHIMFMGQNVAPEDVSGAVLNIELGLDLAKRGDRATFITGAPDYSYGRVFPGYRNRLPGRVLGWDPADAYLELHFAL